MKRVKKHLCQNQIQKFPFGVLLAPQTPKGDLHFKNSPKDAKLQVLLYFGSTKSLIYICNK